MSKLSILESVLFVSSPEGVDINSLKRVLEIPADQIHILLKQLKKKYESDPDSGLTLTNYGSIYRILSKDVNNDFISKIQKVQLKNPLNKTLLEVLAIIVYNSPCPMSKIENIRNADPKSSIEKLLKLGLIVSNKRADGPGRPFLYEPTKEFFNVFGIKKLSDLPKLSDILSEEDEQLYNEIDE